MSIRHRLVFAFAGIGFLLLFPFSLLSSASAEFASPSPLRIGLDKNFRHATAILIASDQDFTICDAVSGQVVLHGTPNIVYRITPAKQEQGLHLIRSEISGETGALDHIGPMIAIPKNAGILQIARVDNTPPGSLAIPWHHYHGTLTVRQEPDATLRVINTVELEAYLCGVLPAEIGTHGPLEAMKAQAVAARTYALKNRGKLAAQGFDLDDTTNCQGYAGADQETALCTAAVDGTRGQVLVYAGALIDAPFSTDCGGMTACDPTGACPYLQAVRDSPSNTSPDYAADSKYHHWTVTLAKTELAALLARDARTQVGQFSELQINGLDASGRITTATVTGEDGTQKTVTGPQLRQILGYELLRSTRVTLTVTQNGAVYQFTGQGWGHGLGMSQLGAIAMAAPPYRKTYKTILSHYYVGAELSSLNALKAMRPMPRLAQPGA